MQLQIVLSLPLPFHFYHKVLLITFPTNHTSGLFIDMFAAKRPLPNVSGPNGAFAQGDLSTGW